MKLYEYLKDKGFTRLLDEPHMQASHAGDGQTFEDLFEGYLKANEPRKFEEAARPLIKWLAENKNPHTTAIVTSTSCELLQGLEGWVCQKCGDIVNGDDVTHEEYHDGCGGKCV